MTAPNPLSPFLADGGRLVLDGALATELERRGADLKDPLWSARVLMEQPALIEAVHRDYFEAGADVATTASYQASFEGFAARGLSPDEAAALMRRSVELAVRARDAFWAAWGAPAGAAEWRGRRRPLVAASVGPWGAMKADGSEYRGYAGTGMDVAALMNFHRPRLAVLARAGADLLACETLPGLDEGLALARLIDEARTQPGLAGLGGWLAFSCRDAAHVSQGERFADVAAALTGFAGVWALGVNCSAPAHVGALLAAARAVTDRPLLAYPNAGETWDAVNKVWRGDAHAPTLADHAAAWGAAGAVMLGGCCRTTPADIAALRARWPRGE